MRMMMTTTTTTTTTTMIDDYDDDSLSILSHIDSDILSVQAEAPVAPWESQQLPKVPLARFFF